MIRSVLSLNWQIRALIVTAFACLTISTGLIAAKANVITATHLAAGQHMLPDGGWTSSCEARAHDCETASAADKAENILGAHHHHHPDCQFSALPPALNQVAKRADYGSVKFLSYLTVDKSTMLVTADQPPKV